MFLQTLCKNIILKNFKKNNQLMSYLSPKFFKHMTMNLAITSNTSSSLIRGTWKKTIDDIVVETTADALKFRMD
jgi:hypothetical protein